MLTEEQKKEYFEELAASGAKKLCGLGTCISGFPCGHEKHSLVKPARLMSTAPECPLAKYNVQTERDPRPWWERKRSEIEPTEEELFALCALCENGEVTELVGGEYLELERKDIRYCFDCPVAMARDGMAELSAEARMS